MAAKLGQTPRILADCLPDHVIMFLMTNLQTLLQIVYSIIHWYIV